jgi:hypothetical protein
MSAKKNVTESDFAAKCEHIREEKEANRSVLDKWGGTLNEIKFNEKQWKKIKNESENSIKKY